MTDTPRNRHQNGELVTGREEPAVRVVDITMEFAGGVRAIEDVSFTVEDLPDYVTAGAPATPVPARVVTEIGLISRSKAPLAIAALARARLSIA